MPLICLFPLISRCQTLLWSNVSVRSVGLSPTFKCNGKHNTLTWHIGYVYVAAVILHNLFRISQSKALPSFFCRFKRGNKLGNCPGGMPPQLSPMVKITISGDFSNFTAIFVIPPQASMLFFTKFSITVPNQSLSTRKTARFIRNRQFKPCQSTQNQDDWLKIQFYFLKPRSGPCLGGGLYLSC